MTKSAVGGEPGHVCLFLLTTCPHGQCCDSVTLLVTVMMSSPSSVSPGPAPAWSCVTMCWLVTTDAMDNCHNMASVIIHDNLSQSQRENAPPGPILHTIWCTCKLKNWGKFPFMEFYVQGFAMKFSFCFIVECLIKSFNKFLNI